MMTEFWLFLEKILTNIDGEKRLSSKFPQYQDWNVGLLAFDKTESLSIIV